MCTACNSLMTSKMNERSYEPGGDILLKLLKSQWLH